MKLTDPRMIWIAASMEMKFGHKPGFIYNSQRGPGCRITDSTGEVLVPTTYGGSVDGAFKNAYEKYKTAPKKKTKNDLAKENEDLRRKLADMEPSVEDDQAEAPAEAAVENQSAAENDSADAKPVKKKRGRPRKQPTV